MMKNAASGSWSDQSKDDGVTEREMPAKLPNEAAQESSVDKNLDKHTDAQAERKVGEPDSKEKASRPPLHRDVSSGYIGDASGMFAADPGQADSEKSECPDSPKSLDGRSYYPKSNLDTKTEAMKLKPDDVDAVVEKRDIEMGAADARGENAMPPPSKRMKPDFSWNDVEEASDLPPDALTPKVVSVSNTGCSVAAAAKSPLAKTPRPTAYGQILAGEASRRADALMRGKESSSRSVSSALSIGCPPTPPTTPLLKSRSVRSSNSSLASLEGTFSWHIGAAEAATPLGDDAENSDDADPQHHREIFRKGSTADEERSLAEPTSAGKTHRTSHAQPNRSASQDFGEEDFSGWNVGDRYEMIRILGRGSYGEVAQAQDKSGKYEFVAIKRIRNAFEQEVDAVRIYREIHILRRLRGHSCIIELVDVIHPTTFEELRDLYLVFECKWRNARTPSMFVLWFSDAPCFSRCRYGLVQVDHVATVSWDRAHPGE
jgi:hypothetical protein